VGQLESSPNRRLEIAVLLIFSGLVFRLFGLQEVSKKILFLDLRGHLKSQFQTPTTRKVIAVFSFVLPQCVRVAQKLTLDSTHC
jgi:hypothetical protein